jgi:hypothetical protein
MSEAQLDLLSNLRNRRRFLTDMVNELTKAIAAVEFDNIPELPGLVYTLPVHIRVQADLVDKLTIPLVIEVCEEARQAGRYTYTDSQDCYEDYVA